jgi:transposase
MIALPSNVRVWLACGHTDMRRGFDGLASQVQQQLGYDPFDDQFFAFRGKRGDLIKFLSWAGQGLSLFAKQLEKGRFILPQAKEGAVSLTPAQLSMLLEGIDWRMPARTWRPERVEENMCQLQEKTWRDANRYWKISPSLLRVLTRPHRSTLPHSHLQVTLSVLATTNEGAVQSDRDRRRRHFRPDRGTITQRRASSQGMPTHGFLVPSRADREHLLEYISGRPIRHECREVSLKPLQFRGRSAMRGPVDADLDRITRGTAEAGEPHRDLTEKRGDRMLPVIFRVTSACAARTIRRHGPWPAPRRSPVGGSPVTASLRPS